MQVYTGTRLTTAIHRRPSLRTADVFPVVTSLPPINIFWRERSDDRKYVCVSQATDVSLPEFFFEGRGRLYTGLRIM